MDRFFVEKEDVNLDSKSLIIRGEDVGHISRVLRYKTGDKLEVCDKENNEYICEIAEIGKKEILLDIIKKVEVNRESRIKIVLYQGIPKSTKMEIILQKLTECGVAEIVLVETERSVVSIDPKKSDKKFERWKRIIYEAAKQSKRGIIPKLRGVLSFSEAIEDMKKNELNISPYEKEENLGIASLLRGEEFKSAIKEGEDIRLGIFVGPEGGFSEEENAIIKNRGIFSVTLGPRIFRTETASIVISAIVMYELGDIG